MQELNRQEGQEWLLSGPPGQARKLRVFAATPIHAVGHGALCRSGRSLA
jgi:hypothetical protein